MRAGRLKVRRYKTRRHSPVWPILLGLLALGCAAFWLLRDTDAGAFLRFTPALSPQDRAAETRTLVLPGKTWYALQLGVFEDTASAGDLAESFRLRGAAGYIARREHYRVLAAAYPTRADAQAVQNQLRTQHQVDAYIYEISRPEITLRLTGQRAQLTALSDAYDALDQSAEQLFALSQAIDQGKEQDYRAALTSTRETATALRGRLAALFDAPPQAVQQVMDLLQALADGLEQAANAQSAVRLGAQIKYCQLLCAVGMADYAAALAP